jgi:5-methylcytosine-specific restriction endonuclease McrA
MPVGVYQRTDYHRKIMSESHKGLVPWNKGIPASEEQKLRLSKLRLGKKVSDETKKKMSLSQTGKKRTPEQRKKMSVWQIGRKMSDEAKMNMSIAAKGKIISLETRKKLSDANKGKQKPSMQGEKNPRWKGGAKNTLILNRKRRAIKLNSEGSHTLGEWELLKKQYGFTCPSCKKSEPEIKLTADHIIPLLKGGSDYIENIQPLCQSCNSKKNTKLIPKYIL